MTLTKSDIIGAVSDHTGFTKKKSHHCVTTLLEIIKHTLESGENVKICHFGKFDIKEKKARSWRSPSTGTIMMLPPRRVVIFKAFKRLTDKINEQSGSIEPEALRDVKISPKHKGALKKDELKKILADHRKWLDSHGKNGGKAVLSNAALVGADLYAAQLSFSDLQGADLREAVLSEADMDDANLRRTNLAGAILDWASLDGAKLQHASLQGADLRWANLEGANMAGANLRFANLEGANLKDVKLTEADLYGANLRNTDMKGAILNNIKLDYETLLDLPRTVFDQFRQTFMIVEWSPALAPSY